LKLTHRAFALVVTALIATAGALAIASETTQQPYKPRVGQEGKDVVWVPTPFVLVEKMLDMAQVTPRDFVMDLGSGDGRNIIAAAKRGARALGVEYNPDMVELARQTAAKEGVADKASFVQGDMYEADISQASVLALFLLPENLRRLTPKFLDLKPGSRIVANGFGIDGWEADETGRSDGDCESWCTAYLYIVPAKVAGTWRLPFGELELDQKFQTFSGKLAVDGSAMPVENGRLRGDQFSFTVGDVQYTGRVSGDTLSGTMKGMRAGRWTATRVRH
jgi:SAM-dependent methyltransferase